MSDLYSKLGSEDLFVGVLCLIAFLLGSIPFGIIVAKIFKVKDLTRRGSGNIGATNVTRVLGFWPAGFFTFLLDVGKGVLAVFLATPVGIRLFSESNHFTLSLLALWTIGFFAVLGHCYSPWLRFKGGKGVAPGFGVVLVLSPLSALSGLLVFALTFLEIRIASLASILGLLSASVIYLIFNPVGIHLWMGAGILMVILIRHETNIDALLENREKSF